MLCLDITVLYLNNVFTIGDVWTFFYRLFCGILTMNKSVASKCPASFAYFDCLESYIVVKHNDLRQTWCCNNCMYLYMYTL